MRLPLRTALFLTAIAALSACPKGGASSTSGDQEAVEEAPPSRFSGPTKTYVDALMRAPIVGWEVADDGAAIVYDALTIAEDGTFSAKTSVRIGDEPLLCTESGTWSLDNDTADSATAGELNFELLETDCAGRDAPRSWRAQATISGDDINFELR
jgi:hypothetical protein